MLMALTQQLKRIYAWRDVQMQAAAINFRHSPV